MKKVGIFGYGEIGQAVGKFYKEFLVKDIAIDEIGNCQLDVLHICLPWLDNFIDLAAEQMKKNSPTITIIHSTVMPGTTKRIREITALPVVHSPVRGVHPNLHKGIKTFVKYVGFDEEEDASFALKELKAMGIKKICFMPKSIITEINKLLDTTYYAHCILYHDYVKDICEKYEIGINNFNHFNKTYNEGYNKLGMGNVVRPILYPPKEKKIGGHCQIPNAEILEKIFPHNITKEILKYK